MMNTRKNMLRTALAVSALLVMSRAAAAGPPLICHPFDAGKAALLPWSTEQGWNSPSRTYDIQRLTADTLRLLSPDAPILARMENLRRATIYASQDRRIAAELLAAVLERTRNVKANGSPDPLAWFDGGYLIETYRQASAAFKWDMLSVAERSASTESSGLDGYPLVTKALNLTGPNPEMEFAASLMKQGAVAAEHRRRAAAGAKAGSLLAKNLGA